jgi:hypothetical protein
VIWNADVLVHLNLEEKSLVSDFLKAMRATCKTVLMAEDWPCLLHVFTNCSDLLDRFDELMLVSPGIDGCSIEAYLNVTAQLDAQPAQTALIDRRPAELANAGLAGLRTIEMDSLATIGSDIFELLGETV